VSAPVDNFVKLALAAAEPEDASSGGVGDLIAGLSQLDEAMPGYVKAGQYYSGEIPEFFASPRLRRAMMRTGAAFRFTSRRSP
jgi:hypothetical protein